MTITPSTGLFPSTQRRVLTSLRNIPTMTTPRRPADHGLDLYLRKTSYARFAWVLSS